MKTWTIILSIYIIILAAVPCCVFDNCPEDKTTTEQIAQNNHDQGDEDGCGTCSPFFNCNTCTTSFIVSQDFFNFTPVGVANSAKIQYAQDIPTSIVGKIWQPPKIS
ncbi:MAG: hypothetical protein MUC81_13170 [Bacteroidia bacterium]|nr:hypothetical protein [Bacteroidia bacterium]